MTAESLLVLGTHNRKKGQELAELLAPHGVEVRTLADFPEALEVEETGDTFAANAALKAAQQASHLGQWVLAEDSGISVDELDGAPGVFSARFAGPDADDDSNNRLLLEKLRGAPPERRGAHYTCHVAVANPQGELRLACEDYCRGRIAAAPRGTNGFGYDPLFELPEYHRTFGELGPAVKAVLSHRSRAMRRVVPQLLELLERVGDQ